MTFTTSPSTSTPPSLSSSARLRRQRRRAERLRRFALAIPLMTLLAAPFVAFNAYDARDPSLTLAQNASLSEAEQAFRERRYAHAYGRLSALADAGHVPSARLAIVMHDQGPALFASGWAATPAQQRRWHALVVNAARNRIDFLDSERGD